MPGDILKTKKKILVIAAAAILFAGLCVAGFFILNPLIKYNRAVGLFDEESFQEAYGIFGELGDYKDAADYTSRCEQELQYIEAESLADGQQYEEAMAIFESLGDLRDSEEMAGFCQNSIDYNAAKEAQGRGDYSIAGELFTALGDFNDSAELAGQMEIFQQFEDLKKTIRTNDYIDTLSYYENYDYKSVNYYNAITAYNQYDFMAEDVGEFLSEYYYKSSASLLKNNSGDPNTPTIIRDQLRQLPQDYRQAGVIADFMDAVVQADCDGIVKYGQGYFEDPDPGFPVDALLGLIRCYQGDSIDSSLAVYNAYRQLRGYGSYDSVRDISELTYYESISVSDDSFFSQCGTDPSGKVLVYDSSQEFGDPQILTGIMDFYPDEYIPKNLAEVQYIVEIATNGEKIGMYTNGTEADVMVAEARIIECPSMNVIKTFGSVRGGDPDYYIYTSAYESVAGTAPDYFEVQELLVKAVGYYIQKGSFEDYDYYIYNGGAVIDKYNGNSGTPVVPDEIEGFPVTYIDYDAFIGHEGITGITLPKDLITLNSCLMGFTGLTEITLPKNLVQVGYGALKNCTSLETVNFNDRLKGIFDGAFMGCTALKNIEIPAGVTALGAESFKGCLNLSGVKLAESLPGIGAGCFADCTGLAAVQLAEGLQDLDNWCFMGCTGLAEITLPDSVSFIGSSVFEGCASLEKVNMPASLTWIGDKAFKGTIIGSITLPDNIAVIGAEAFNGCKGIGELFLPASLKEINMSAFSLADITLYVNENTNAQRAAEGSKYDVIVTEYDSIEEYKSNT